MAYVVVKDLNKRIFADKLLRDEAFNFAKDPKYDGYQGGTVLTVYKCFDKKRFLGVVLKMKIFIIKN